LGQTPNHGVGAVQAARSRARRLLAALAARGWPSSLVASGRLASLVACGWLALPAAAAGPAAAEPPPAALRCAGEETDARLAQWRARAAENGLYRYAVEQLGPPTACEGKRRGVEEADIGRLRFSFAGGGLFQIETALPESSRVVLEVPAGFADEAGARSALESYAREIGVRIDWSKPSEEAASARERVVTYWDPTPGLNAGADLVYRQGKLVRIALHLAP
jgi:hypothetical protein